MAGIVVRPQPRGTAPAKTETVDDSLPSHRWGWYARVQLRHGGWRFVSAATTSTRKAKYHQ